MRIDQPDQTVCRATYAEIDQVSGVIMHKSHGPTDIKIGEVYLTGVSQVSSYSETGRPCTPFSAERIINCVFIADDGNMYRAASCLRLTLQLPGGPYSALTHAAGKCLAAAAAAARGRTSIVAQVHKVRLHEVLVYECMYVYVQA